VLVGGGSGFIGTALVRHLAKQGHSLRLISRSKGSGGERLTWDEVEKQGLPQCDAIVNLSGANLMATLLWTNSYRQEVWDSRINTTQTIAHAIERMSQSERPKVFVSASAVGFYPTGIPGPEVDEEYTPHVDSWMGQLTAAWESAADQARDLTRVVKVRTGIVLGKEGGALASMLPLFKLGLGNVMGDGRQYYPWIHLDDIIGIFEHALIHDNVTGVVNGVAPDSQSAQEFAGCLAQVMGTSVKLHVPSFIINLLFGPERGTLLLEGHKVNPKHTLQSGYKYKHPELREALRDILFAPKT